MKSFAVLALAGAVAAQNVGSLSSCAQLCINNMATIANQQFQCAAGDVACFCSRSNWAYGVRDCSQQACSATDSAQAIAWAAGQCGQNAPSGTPAPAIPILTSALGSATGAAASAAASVTGSLGSAAGSAGSAAASATGSLASRASSLAGSAASALSSLAASASSAASGAAASASSAAGSAASSASGALNSAASSLAGAASSRAASATASPGAAPKMTGVPVAVGAGLAALLLL